MKYLFEILKNIIYLVDKGIDRTKLEMEQRI